MSETDRPLPEIHHVTAITADAQKNFDFYSGVLGLRLVKLTVNFDDPGSYHLYYGDETGKPGTILTFFAWPGAQRGRIGPPQVTATAFAVPNSSIDFWTDHLKKNGAETRPVFERFGSKVLSFADPDGMQLEIVTSGESGGEPRKDGPVPVEHAIRGFHSVTVSEEGYENTARLLTEVMGFANIGTEQNRFRYKAKSADGFASIVDLICVPGGKHGGMGAGAVHHVAFRTPGDGEQLAWHKEIIERGYNVSPVMDRTYFHSIYFREPGGVLFEIATDSPGFTADQPAADLGKKLMLPPWLERHRPEIEKALPKLDQSGKKKDKAQERTA